MCRGALQIAVVLVLAMLPAAGTRAAEAPEPFTDPVLAGLVRESLAARPELAQAAATVRAERERAPQEGALPDPMLQLGVQNDGFSSWEVGKMETSYYAIMVSQAVPWPGALRLRGEVASLGAEQREQDLARLRLSTEADVRRSYLELLLARERLGLLARLEGLWTKAAALAKTRYEVGEGAQSDVLRSQLELNRLQLRRWSLGVEEQTRLQELNRLRARPLGEPIATSVHLADLALPTLRDAEAALRDARARSPELAAAKVGRAQAERSVALARRGYVPELTVNLGVMPRGGDFPPMWQASLGFSLPVYAFAKQSRAVDESLARGAARAREAEAIDQRLVLRTLQRRTALAAMLEAIRLFRDGLLVQSDATVDSTLAQYQVGRVTFASVLEANAGFVADQEGYLQALARAHRLEVDALEVSLAPVGAPPEGMAPSPAPAVGSEGSSAAPGMGGMR